MRCRLSAETPKEGRRTKALANIREAIEACLEAQAANGMPLTVATREIEVAV